MSEIKVYAIHFTEKNSLESVMTDEFIKLFNEYGASPVGMTPPGMILSLIFRTKSNAKKCRLLAMRRGYHVTDVQEAFVDEQYAYIMEHNEAKMPQVEVVEDDVEVMGLKSIISELQSANARLKADNEVLEGVVRSLKTKHEAEMCERDKRLKKLSKECLALEHRMKEMEDAWKGWKE